MVSPSTGSGCRATSKPKIEMKQKQLGFLILFTFITVFFWVFFETYRSIKQKNLPLDVREAAEALDPQIDTKFLEGLKSNRNYKAE